MSTIKKVTDATFEEEVLKSEKPVLVDFWAPWCPPCVAMEPVLNMFAREHADKIDVVKVNIDENQAAPASYQIRSIPTMLVFEKGKVVKTMVGMKPKMVMEGELSSFIG